MVFLQQAFGFLVIAVGIQSALSRVCPILCPDVYTPICALNHIGSVKQIFPNQCVLDAAICLNGKPYDDVEWQPCDLVQLLTGSSIDFQFGNNSSDGTNFNFNGNDNENGSNNENNVQNQPPLEITPLKLTDIRFGIL